MRMTRDEFVKRYGGVYEHSNWVAEQSYDQAIASDNVDMLANIFASCVESASREQKLALIRAHPDLAGKAATAGELTEESGEEQASAGIDQCSAEEFTRFQSSNDRYKEKFAFPFVMAVRGSNRQQILTAFEERLNNDTDTEFARAITEIHKIARLRLQAMNDV
jgi:2-oxo-4-hydroxy-4-carboxy-5-ureidoimidazoline decarboxylase